MPKLSEDYHAVPPGEIYPVLFKKGESVDGELAEMARRDGKLAPERKAHRKAPENK